MTQIKLRNIFLQNSEGKIEQVIQNKKKLCLSLKENKKEIL